MDTSQLNSQTTADQIKWVLQALPDQTDAEALSRAGILMGHGPFPVDDLQALVHEDWNTICWGCPNGYFGLCLHGVPLRPSLVERSWQVIDEMFGKYELPRSNLGDITPESQDQMIMNGTDDLTQGRLASTTIGQDTSPVASTSTSNDTTHEVEEEEPQRRASLPRAVKQGGQDATRNILSNRKSTISTKTRGE